MKIQVKSKGFASYLATQFLGAFNDNAFKLFICILVISGLGVAEENRTLYTALGGMIFTAPFLLFASYAGFLSDRFPKRRVMVWMKFTEILVMIGGCIAFSFASIPGMLVALFLMGTQSAFFGPAKYGWLPESLPNTELSKGNGLVNMWTYAAIILGSALAGGLAFLFADHSWVTYAAFVGTAAAGFIASLFISESEGTSRKSTFRLNPFSETLEAFRHVRSRRPLFLCILGSTYFWFVGALFQVNLLLYASKIPGINELKAGALQAILALGIGLGGLLAARWSGKKVEFGLVPLGGAALAFFPLFFGLCSSSFVWSALLLIPIGAGAGLFTLPLNAYIQQKSPADGKGRILAFNNFVNFSAMLFAYPLWYVMNHVLGMSPSMIFAGAGILTAAVVVYIIYLLPDFLIRFIMWLATHSLYKIRIKGSENLPEEGGALLVCNHVSYMDACLIQAGIQRFIRFVMHRSWYERKWLKPFCRILRVVPIASEDSPKKLIASLREASKRVNEGEIVCIFAEGAISRTGNLLPFNRGLEIIMKNVDAPIIPVYLDRIWGSAFSFENGKLRRLPSRIPHPITLAFGKPMPGNSQARKVQGAVSELSADCFKLRSNKDLLSTRFIKQARRAPFRFCMSDTLGKSLNYAQTCIGAMAFSRALGRQCNDQQHIGFMLPNCCGAAIANVAGTMLGKCTVNLNYTAGEEALTKAIEKCKISTVITSRKFLKKLAIEPRAGWIYIEDFIANVSQWDKVIATVSFVLLPASLIAHFYRQSRKASTSDIATVMFSSGSTGDPKGVMLSHSNMNANIEALYQTFRIQDDDSILGVLPLFHSFGYSGALWLPLTTGMSVAYHANPLDVKTVGELVEKYKITLLTATPTFLTGYLRKCTEEQFKTLRYVVVGAEKLKPKLAEMFQRKFGVTPLEGYGCTELSPFVAVNVPDFHTEDVTQIGFKSGTIGKPLPGVAAMIVDPDTLEPLSGDEAGLLLIKGANVMKGYIGEEERTAKVMYKDWYITGDLATIDTDGFITIRDRLSRFSKIGGEMVPHLRIEEEIHSLLNKSGEQICVVTAVPDERKGERLVVLYKGELDIETLYQKLSCSTLPKLWIPKKDSFRSIPEIPLLGSGKLDLKNLKKIAYESV